MQIQDIFKRISLIFPAIFLAACSSTVTIPPAEQTPDQPVAVEADELTKVDDAEPVETNLSPEMLFQLMLAEIAGQRGQIDLSVKYYLVAARESRDPKIIERATRIAVYARDNNSALEAARMWVEIQPNNIEAQQVVAAMFLRSGDAESAHRHLEKVINLKVGKNNAFMLITSLLSKERDKQVALNVMEKLVATRQQNHDALYAYSQLAMLVGELDKALSAAEKVRNLKPEWDQAHILYSNVLHRQGKNSQALSELKQAVNNNPSSVLLRDYYARRLVDEKQYENAREQFQVLIDDSPDNSEARYALALLTLQTRDYDSSQKHFNKLYKTGKRIEESSYYLGQIAEQRDQTEKAIKWYSKVEEGQYLIEAQIRIAMLESKKGKLEEARQRLHAIEATTADIEQRLFLAEGEMLRDAKRYQEAFDLYSEALATMPDNISLLYARALIAEKIERVDVTLSDLKKILAAQPGNAQALNALGYTLVDRTDRLEEGFNYIKKAYQLNPDDPAILDSMGWAHYRMGKYEEAAKFLRQAFSKLNDAEIAAHLGEVLWVLGDQDEARNIWDEAIRATPSHKLLLDVIKRFTK